MRKSLAWIESVLGLVTGALFALTLVTPTWIENLGMDPDMGNGSVEKMIVVGLAIVTLALFSLAFVQFRKPAAA